MTSQNSSTVNILTKSQAPVSFHERICIHKIMASHAHGWGHCDGPPYSCVVTPDSRLEWEGGAKYEVTCPGCHYRLGVATQGEVDAIKSLGCEAHTSPKSDDQEPSDMTLEQARQMVVSAGHKLGVSYETEQIVYACSMESVPGTFGHPRYEVTWNKETGRRHVND